MKALAADKRQLQRTRGRSWERVGRLPRLALGQFERVLDDKGRVAIPSELRQSLGSPAVLARGFDQCLYLYPRQKWERLAESVDDLPQLRYEARSFARLLFSGAALCDFDRQGRIAIPQFLRDYADLGSALMVVGVNGHAEIWDRGRWTAERNKFEGQQPQLKEALAAVGA